MAEYIINSYLIALLLIASIGAAVSFVRLMGTGNYRYGFWDAALFTALFGTMLIIWRAP